MTEQQDGNCLHGLGSKTQLHMCAAGTFFVGAGATSAAGCSVWAKFNSSTRRELAGPLSAQVVLQDGIYRKINQRVQIESNMEPLSPDSNRW